MFFEASISRTGGSVLAWWARDPRFEPRLRRFDIRNWTSSASKSRYDWNIVSATLILKTIQTNQVDFFSFERDVFTGVDKIRKSVNIQGVSHEQWCGMTTNA